VRRPKIRTRKAETAPAAVFALQTHPLLGAADPG
jgi:hypothetical protein